MQQIIVQRGQIKRVEQLQPRVEPGHILIKTHFSAISTGTEISSVQQAGKSIWDKVRERPEQISKVIETVKTIGVSQTLSKIDAKLNAENLLGYSISGEITQIGEGVTKFSVGEKVAAAGASYAFHAEYVLVPENLVVKTPITLPLNQASTVAIGGIAVHALRRGGLQLGEYAVVIGAGLIGQILVQLLKASGVRVAIIDLDQKRLDIAGNFGADILIHAGKEDQVKVVQSWTNGHGCDAVFFTAATESSEPLSMAFKMSKRKGKVILVGISGMSIKREDLYEKEIDFQISTSYGPGRYDEQYEKKGVDYPYAYVRWTQNRNMEEYLRLISIGVLNIEKLIHQVFPIESVELAYVELSSSEKPLLCLLSYSEKTAPELKVLEITPFKKKGGQLEVAVIGAGSFASGVHLPQIKKHPRLHLKTIVSTHSYKSRNTAREFEAIEVINDIEKALNDPDIDIILISTRHDSHTDFAMRALKAKKHVYLEKPLCVNKTELEEWGKYLTSKDFSTQLMVGFNRRFSPHTIELKKHTDKRIHPLFLTYRINAGFIPKENWVHEFGGRIVGECCHFIDLMRFIVGSHIKSVSFDHLTPKENYLQSSDNVSMIIKFADGSLGNLNYHSNGAKDLPKELLEVHFDHKSIVIEDFKSLKGYGLKIKEITTETQDKGLSDVWDKFIQAIETGKPAIPMQELLEVSDVTLKLVD